MTATKGLLIQTLFVFHQLQPCLCVICRRMIFCVIYMRIHGPMFVIYLFIYFASVLSHLVTMDLSRFVQVEYSLINNEHKLDTLVV